MTTLMIDCIFCKIASGEIGDERLLYKGAHVVGFADANPVAPVHVLFIPRAHIASMNDVTDDGSEMLGELLFAAKEYAKKSGIDESGYKLLIRTGEHGGQEVQHIHLHLIGGAPLYEEIREV